ncbi:MAG: DUF177 domain-containing protein [Paracoccaceae bacterium]|nr:DUF177 domain-containing protein [Paracoccaceae bacterium]
MTDTQRPFRSADLARRAALPFRIEPDAEARAALASRLGASAIRKLRFEGEIRPEGKGDWRLEAKLGATVVQPCVATLAPVTTRIDETVERRYLAHWSEPEPGSETKMPGDETAEPLGGEIDPAAVMEEALALALPEYPRAEGAELGAAVFTEPGAEPLTDETARPFAALGKLKKDES